MGPKQVSPYNADLPANWTAACLKQTLNARGMSFPTNARRSVLIRLLSNGPEQLSDSARSHNATVSDNGDLRSQDATVHNNNNGGLQATSGGSQNQAVVIDLVSKLTLTVQSLQQNVINLTTRVNNLSSIRDGSGNVPVGPMTVSLGPTTCSSNVPFPTTDNYNLDTAFARLSSAAAGSSTQAAEFKRTRFGYSAESLPMVKTISPLLRQHITSDEEIPGTCARSRWESHSLSASLPIVYGLKEELVNLWDSSLCSSTKRIYSSALQCFLTFVCMSGVMVQSKCLPAVNESLLMYFVTHCKHVLKLGYETIKLYLAGLRYHYIKAGWGDILKSCDQFHYILRGVKRVQNNVKSKRLPITAILKQMWQILDNGAFSPFVDLMLKCMFSCAYFGFLRCGETICRSAN
ncbi:uncharacterized protein LOC125682096 [Ostrea edulis]|uniref:uncharacterized protein LOC125682096 n=1 Tax=Ostrea edulis TaxID=37623 RepID=UPI0020940DE9|nr:uncharacterized protein LOC125682096 [Ostrea edulis]XP_048778467.1 uncharacterized protein LOC125682096 [Ostrea edulis]